MASRKELKKQIKEVTGQLALEILFRGTVLQALEPEKMYSLLSEVISMNQRFISRVNAAKGKKGTKEVNDFYRQFFSDWKNEINKINQDLKRDEIKS